MLNDAIDEESNANLEEALNLYTNAIEHYLKAVEIIYLVKKKKKKTFLT
jgi:hypothetical protein